MNSDFETNKYKTELPEIDRELIYIFAGERIEEKALIDKAASILKRIGDKVYAAILFKLTHKEFSNTEAKRIWKEIVNHREKLQNKLKREVKLEVAALDYFQFITREMKNPSILEEKLLDHIEETILIDELTGIYNYRYYKKRIKEEIIKSKRYNSVFSLIIFDIDDFKKYNDKCGHLAGNIVLKTIADLGKASLRASDVFIRFGGEEFVSILPYTGKKEAIITGEKFREKVSIQHFNKKITISGGLATFLIDTDKNEEELFKLADMALYKAKGEGKNRVCCEPVERRIFPRLLLYDKKFVFKIVSLGQLRNKEKKIKDISPGGVSFYIDQNIEKGDYLKAEIYVIGKTIKFTGQVVRSEQMGEGLIEVGVKFIEISKTDLSLIKAIKL